MRKSKYVENFWIKKFDNGIYQLTFNTSERWIFFHQFCDYQYQIGGSSEDNGFEENLIQEIPKDIIPENISYQNLVQQEKDQIYFYFIPTEMVFRNGEIIYNSKNI